MPKIVFRYDTEDYVNEYGAEGIMRAIRPLDEAGITGCFVVVGKLALALEKWGRWDVIEALKRHEIGTHTLSHSAHPTINEYTDLEDFDKALSNFMEDERACLSILYRVFGDNIAMESTSGPGNSISYVAQYGYAELGIREYLGGFTRDEIKNRPVYFCNVINTTTNYCLDRLYELSLADIDAKIEELAAFEAVILCHHPAMNMMKEYWDKVNFDGVNTPESEWRESLRLSEEEMAAWMENYTYFVNKIKNDARFEIITSEKIEETYFPQKERLIDKETLKAIRPQIEEELFPVTTPDSFCLADIVYACRDLLLGKEKHICGKVYGFLSTPYAVTSPITLTKAELKIAASQIGDTFLPESLTAGDKKFGVADFLRAALVLLTEETESVTVTPGPWQIDLNQFPLLRDMNLKNSWVHTKEFEDAYISNRSRLQFYTARLPQGTQRKIM